MSQICPNCNEKCPDASNYCGMCRAKLPNAPDYLKDYNKEKTKIQTEIPVNNKEILERLIEPEIQRRLLNVIVTKAIDRADSHSRYEQYFSSEITDLIYHELTKK